MALALQTFMTSCVLSSTWWHFCIWVCWLTVFLTSRSDGVPVASTWPQDYSVQRDDLAGVLSLRTPFYEVVHDLKRGGAIAAIRLTHGLATNLLTHPMEARLRNADDVLFRDALDSEATVSNHKEGTFEIVTVEGKLKDANGRILDVVVKSIFEYHWGYIKIHKEFRRLSPSVKVREVCPFATVVAPNLTSYGYREGITEYEGAPPFSFDSNRWGKLLATSPNDPLVQTGFMPRSVLLADPGVEGLEWFAGSDLWQWDLQLSDRRGQGRFTLRRSLDSPGLSLSIAPLSRTERSIELPSKCTFDFYVGIPLLEGHVLRPWFHTSFNRNRGEWVSTTQIHAWAEAGIQTVHCHNDGDYYEDGLFWRDGAYPPYPDMERFDRVVSDCQRAGLKVATYFSNKELHPSTREYQDHGRDWGRMNREGKLQHNVFRGTNEFGVQMCLRSGWLEFLKLSIDRAVRNHHLDGVYYDWNVALACFNPLHEGKKSDATATGHWDIDELLNLMEWTRQRVGANGLIIVHNTTTPMFTMENFADKIVANEWGYGTWKDDGPALNQLPLEWSLVNARARGVISYGQLNEQSPKRLYRMFALEALVSGVTPWPASSEAFELWAPLRRVDVEKFVFADWRNPAVVLGNDRCTSAIYSRPQESYIVIGNLTGAAQNVHFRLFPEKLPCPMANPGIVTLVHEGSGRETNVLASRLDIRQLLGDGIPLTLPPDGTLWLKIQP